ncbi:MAG TPA: hypothetical protein DCL35_02845 [Candidatus Omnitrophica bacterium]|nr:hypothetical protein [Candidatus Omnitrophota bacterium]
MKDHAKKIILFSLLAGICFFNLEAPALAKEVKIVFTGQSYAMLYPCQCPHEPDGGVARRAAMFKKLRSGTPDVVFVEAGSSLASGQQDQYSQNYEADIRRTEVYLKALSLIGYDALLVSSQEYSFGNEFLSRYKNLPFISSNMDGFYRPYVIKDLGWIKVGILGLTDELVTARGISGWQVPSALLAQRVAELKKSGAGIIILLSGLTPQEDRDLTESVKGIDVVINGSPSYGTVNLVEAGGALYFTTWWQARKLGVLTLEVSDGVVTNKKLEAVRLSRDIGGDEAVGSIVPQCFSSMDCERMPAFVTKCVNPGQQEASCVFIKPGRVSLTVITPRVCRTCRVDDLLKSLESGLGEMFVRRIFEDEPEARSIIKESGIKMLPAYLFPIDFERSEFFPSFKHILDKGAGFYLIKPENSGVSYILDRERTPKTLDVVFGFDAATSPELFGMLKVFSEKHKDVDVRINLLAVPDKDNAGQFLIREADESELEELRHIACIDSLYPKNTLDYLICRFKQNGPGLRETCLAASKINAAKIKSCVVSPQGQKSMTGHTRLTEELRIASGPTFVIDNSEIFSVINVPSLEEFERVVFGQDKKEKIKERGNDEDTKTK